LTRLKKENNRKEYRHTLFALKRFFAETLMNTASECICKIVMNTDTFVLYSAISEVLLSFTYNYEGESGEKNCIFRRLKE